MILIDENLSYKLSARLYSLFPCIRAVVKVPELGPSATDTQVWTYAKKYDLCILTVDKDFEDRVKRHGPPPKVIRLIVGNERVAMTEQLIKQHANKIHQFLSGLEGFIFIKR